MKIFRACPLFLLSLALMLGLGCCAMLLPRRDFSEMENRRLQRFPMLTASSALSSRWMERTETALSDQFPFRDGWVRLNALWDAALGRNERNGILFGRDGRLFGHPWFSGQELDNIADNVEAMEELAKATGLPTRIALVPTAADAYQQDLPTFAPRTDERRFLDALYGSLTHAQPVTFGDIRASDTPAYYRTDHHWTAAGAYQAYLRLRTGYSPSPTDVKLVQQSVENFYGSYYARAPSPLTPPDTLTYYNPPGLRLWIAGEEMPSLVDEAQLFRRDKYAALCWGNQGTLTLLNEEIAGGTLLVIRDSYASALLPLLAMHFHRVEAVDLRYAQVDLLQYIREKEATEILCLYGLSTLRTDRRLVLDFYLSSQQ